MLRVLFASALRPTRMGAPTITVLRAAAHGAKPLQARALSSAARPQSTVLGALRPRAGALASSFFLSSRTLMTDSASVISRPTQQEAWKRFAIAGGTVAVTFIAVNAFFNRETREGLSAAEQSLLHQSFQYTGGGLVLTALAARSLFKSGFAFRLMAANPSTRVPSASARRRLPAHRPRLRASLASALAQVDSERARRPHPCAAHACAPILPSYPGHRRVLAPRPHDDRVDRTLAAHADAFPHADRVPLSRPRPRTSASTHVRVHPPTPTTRRPPQPARSDALRATTAPTPLLRRPAEPARC